MSLIEEFMERYAREYDYYCQVAKKAEELCQSWLEKNAIRGIVTSRGKNPRSLREKLYSRASRRQYEHLDDIYRDIVDLAGVRIALYFPNNLLDIDAIFKRHLHVSRIVEFPRKDNDKVKRIAPEFVRKNKGYVATHYRAYLKPESLKSSETRFSHAPIEIQVASVLMHAWSEVEHDLAYKARAGDLSQAELEVLDEINGIVLSGEEALLRLWQAGDQRLSKNSNRIKNKYELSALLHQMVDRLPHGDCKDLNVDEVETMMDFLSKTGCDSTEQLEAAFAKLSTKTAKENICRRIMSATKSRSSGQLELQPLETLGQWPS